ncbi:Hypothetical predicted protein, partial [Pelobates cultripes]
FRKTMQPLTITLREHQINYRWEYPAKLLVHHHDSLHAIMTMDEGLGKLREWNIPTPTVKQHKPTTFPRISLEWSTT